MTNKEIILTICPLQKRERFIHSLNVADMAKRLAQVYNADTEKAYTAGLVHDCTKNMSGEKQLEIIKNGGIVLTPLELESPKLWHAVSGSVFARTNLGIEDRDVLSAVRFHTTGKADMTMLEKIIYVADYVSEERSFPGVEQMRKTAFESIDRAVYIGANFTVEKLESLSLPVHPDTVAARDYYCEV